jgi:Rieske Fe-S protein
MDFIQLVIRSFSCSTIVHRWRPKVSILAIDVKLVNMPQTSNSENPFDRRTFVARSAAVIALAATPFGLRRVVESVFHSDNKDLSVDVSNLSVGSSMVTADKAANGAPVLVRRTGEDSFTAMSMRCTHKGCTVQRDGGGLRCPCHGSRFDASSGASLKGPAKDPLAKFPSTYDKASGQLRIIT